MPPTDQPGDWSDLGSARRTPRLLPVGRARRAQAVVLVLHGGAQREGRPAVSPTQPSVLRMVPVARRVARAGRGRLAVHRLLNTTRGWDAAHSPVDDVRWALQQLREQHGDLPVGLVGHSLGGRAALLAGDAPGVRSVVALNPWLHTGDDVDLTGRRVLFVHGTDDRIADPARAHVVARRLADRARSVGFLEVEGGKHAMLRRGQVFERAAAEFSVATLLERDVTGPVRSLLSGVASLSV